MIVGRLSTVASMPVHHHWVTFTLIQRCLNVVCPTGLATVTEQKKQMASLTITDLPIMESAPKSESLTFSNVCVTVLSESVVTVPRSPTSLKINQSISQSINQPIDQSSNKWIRYHILKRRPDPENVAAFVSILIEWRNYHKTTQE